MSESAENLMKSFLTGRRMFVELQGYKSSMIQLGSKSVLHGSKLASFFYTMYPLDIGKVRQVMMIPKLYSKLTRKLNSEIESNSHENATYADDLSQILAKLKSNEFAYLFMYPI